MTYVGREVIESALAQPGGWHIMTTCIVGQTAVHLHKEHGVTPARPDDNHAARDNLAAHFKAHRENQ